jgi:hypothetical protein
LDDCSGIQRCCIVAADTGSFWDITVQKLHVHCGGRQVCAILMETKNRSSSMAETMNIISPRPELLKKRPSSLL